MLSVVRRLAVPLALMVNELVTNAIKHGGHGCRIVLLRGAPGDTLELTVSDAGRGPSPDGPRQGMGSRILRGLARQLGATIEAGAGTSGYAVRAVIPLPAEP